MVIFSETCYLRISPGLELIMSVAFFFHKAAIVGFTRMGLATLAWIYQGAGNLLLEHFKLF